MGIPLPALAEALQERYALQRELGRGGMATVYLATDLKHKRPVALKVLLPELAQSLGPERFRREIELAARLQHPHILSVHDSGETAGQLWFTMPFVEGESLRDRLSRQTQLPIEDAVQIAREAAQALEYAHQHGVIHRDIKPENILLTADGSTLVADFGIARVLLGDDERLTGTGLAVGTPAYMSPEQASGGELGVSTDIYSLSCVLYEMLVGEPPFTGRTPQAILARSISGIVPSLRAVRPAVPIALEKAVIRALAPVPADRFASMAEFGRALTASAVSPTPGSTDATPIRGVRLSRRALVTAVAALGVLAIGAGLIFKGGKPPEHRAADGTIRIAVLPFENLGRSEDEYFAEGMTDEVRGKLAALSALSVIARASSSDYKGTTKRPAQIGKELGVQYLLSATVRWDKGEGVSRVRVSPELIRASDASTTWQQPFDAAMTDVFAVQGQIASQVAQALDVALGNKEKQTLSRKPTQNLAAYDAFLKGEAAAGGLGYSLGFGNLQRACAFYEQALALDSSFAQAWAQLGRARAWLYSVAQYTDIAAARRIIERAVALAPDLPAGRLALGDYYAFMVRDASQARQSYEEALQLAPASAEVLTALALSEQSLGRWEESLSHLRQARELDPRSAATATQLAQNLNRLRRFPEGLVAADSAIALAPNDLGTIVVKVLGYLGQGDLAGARAFLRALPSTVQPTALVAWLASFSDLYWVLEEPQQLLLLRLPPSAFADERAIWALVRAQVYHLRGDLPKARVYADTARLEFEAQLRSAPEDAQRLVLLGLALAYLGNKAQAIATGERATSMWPVSRDAAIGAYIQHQLVRIYILTGEYDKALDRLEPLVRIPYDLSPALLRIDPNFNPLRKDPRFQRLAAGKPEA